MIISVEEYVGGIKTPPEYIDKDERGIEYPAPYYMRAIADKWYPDWSFNNMSTIIVLDHVGKPVESVMTGQLEFTSYNIDTETLKRVEGSERLRTGGIAASHKIQYSKERGTILDMGNDVKASVTDVIKKGWNLYMHICDDIYRWESPQISEKQHEYLYDLIDKIDPSKHPKEYKEFLQALKDPNFKINKLNFSEALRRVKNILSTESNNEKE